MIKVAIAGASGYTGGELLRILASHPQVEVVSITSERSAGKPLDQVFPYLKQFFSLFFEPLDMDKLSSVGDVIFTALPHGTSMEPVGKLVDRGKKVVDLSADFRLNKPELYEEWYGMRHMRSDLLSMSVYGLPEIYGDAIKKAQLVANPGCYPTASILALAPLLRYGLIRTDSIFIDAKSGVSGAGRSPAMAYHFTEIHDGLSAYKVGIHRHTPEMAQEFSKMAGEDVNIYFVPHLVPINRGILCTTYALLRKTLTPGEVIDIYREFYENAPFVRILEEGRQPSIKDVRGSNFCDIGITISRDKRSIIVISAIDNLVKGAAGAAVQNMNLMMGLDETEGLKAPGWFP